MCMKQGQLGMKPNRRNDSKQQVQQVQQQGNTRGSHRNNTETKTLGRRRLHLPLVCF